MKTKKDLEKRLIEINTEIESSRNKIQTLRDEGLKIVGQVELLTEQEKDVKERTPE